MAATGLALAYYVKNGAGVAGLTVDVTVVSTALADLTEAVVVNAQPMTASANLAGMYRYRVPNLDFENYWYTFKAVTAGDVDEKELAGLLHDLTMVEMTAYGVGTAVAGDAMTLEAAERTTLAGVVDTELSGIHGAGSWEAAGGGDYTEVLAAIKAKTDRIGTGTATLVAPVTRSGSVRVIQGDAYYNTDNGRALDWSDDTWNVAETSTVVVVLHGVITFVAERLSATQIRLELSSAQTLALPVGNAVFSVQEITAEGNTLSRVPYGAWNTAAQPVPVYAP